MLSGSFHTAADPANGIIAETFNTFVALLQYPPGPQLIFVNTTNGIVMGFRAPLGAPGPYTIDTVAPYWSYIYDAPNSYGFISGTVAAVPEPASLLLLGSGLVAVAARLRWKRRA